MTRSAAYDQGVSTTTHQSDHAPLPLLVLGQGRELATERGVECPGELPAPSEPGLVERARVAKAALGNKVFILGHHYQRNEVIEFADVTGDSFKLAKEAAARPEAAYIVFCGVHFVADALVPVTYMNSSAAIKAFTGRHGGTICTSSNAKTAMQWAFDQHGGVGG